MNELEEARNCWSKAKQTKSPVLSQSTVHSLVTSRAKREQKVITEYIVASGVWQLIVYAFMTHFVIRFWGDWSILGWCLGGILLYIPFTFVFLKKFKGMCSGTLNKPVIHDQAILHYVKNQFRLLSEFFQFKKGFDFVGVPVSCFIILIIIFKLYMPHPIETYIVGASITYLLILVIFILAILHENKKRFHKPLHHLEAMIKEMEQDMSV